jgi:hypothetical protein
MCKFLEYEREVTLLEYKQVNVFLIAPDVTKQDNAYYQKDNLHTIF